MEAARPRRQAGQRMDAFRHRAVPQRPALHHARDVGSLPEEFTSYRRADRGPRPGHERLRRRQPRLRTRNDGTHLQHWPQHLPLSEHLEGRSAPGQEIRSGRRCAQLEMLAESFNLFNHQNVTEIETTGYTIDSGSPPSTLGASGTLPTLNFLTGLKTSSTTGLPIPGFGQPLNIDATDFYRERQIELGLRMRF